MEKKSKKSIVIGLSVMFVVILVILGITYAYYRTRIIDNPNNESISVTSKKLEVTYRDGSAYFISGVTGVESEIAGGVKDKIEPGDSFKKVFSVENTGDGAAKYSIKIDNIETTYERMQDWTYTLSGGNLNEPISGTIPSADAYIVNSISIDADEVQNYTLVITYANSTEDQSVDMGASLKFRVNIADEYEKDPSLSGSDSNTLLFSLKNNFPTGEGETTPGKEASLATEARVIEVEDDYDVSYVYRGNVENNYVNFSGMCWRVVRIDGNNNIKLVLADENGECNADTYNLDNTKSAFVGGRTDIAYNARAAYAATSLLFANSDIPLVLSDWAEEKNLDMSQLIEAEWCNDTAIIEGRLDEEDHAYNKYGAYKRLVSLESAEPTLKCDTDGIEGSTGIEAIATKYKNVLGILSADEVAFAGSTFYESGLTYNYYLQTNATGSMYWTMSPYMLQGDYPLVFAVLPNGSVSGDGDVLNDEDFAVRPAVVLKSDATLGTTDYVQDGTIDAPYVIN